MRFIYLEVYAIAALLASKKRSSRVIAFPCSCCFRRSTVLDLHVRGEKEASLGFFIPVYSMHFEQ